MRLFLAPLIIWIILNAGVDFYIFQCLRKRFARYPFLSYFQAITAFLLLALVIIVICLPLRSGNERILLTVNWLLFIYITCYIPKYLFFIIDLVSRLPRLWKGSNWKWVSCGGACLAGLIFLLFWWGALINRYNIEIKEVTLEIKNLPESFSGYRILQFSDFHLGTYGNDTTFPHKIVNVINSLNPDIILFTGDIVNRQSRELVPFIDTLSELKAPDGTIAILGNHDYGDYYQWQDEAAKRENMEQLYDLFDKMGWRLLRNETCWMVRGRDSLAIIGVENIGDPPFPVYGSLEKAYPQVNDSFPKILLTHNPAHWVDSIEPFPEKNIPLTLSGHTHAMQIKLFGWSPSQWRYKTWGGLYLDSDGRRKLYVNIGLGTVGLPMRIGATPELTLITLERMKD